MKAHDFNLITCNVSRNVGEKIKHKRNYIDGLFLKHIIFFQIKLLQIKMK